MKLITAALTAALLSPTPLGLTATNDAATAIPAAHTTTITDARTYARRASRSAHDYSCLVRLWKRESNWRPTADNPHSSAYGIAQLLHETSTNPVTQVRHGLAYIRTRYGNACTAYAHSLRHGWY